MDAKPRFSRITDLIELIIFMSSKLNGVSLTDIQERFNVSRRTAERMRDSVMLALPQVDEIETNERIKRWGFTSYTLSELVYFNSDEIAFLEKLKTNCDDVAQKELDDIITKLKASNRRKIQDAEDRVELLLKSEGYAISQSQSYKVDFKFVSDIRLGIKECRKLTATYNDKERSLIPLGLIYGEKVFLVAKEDGKGDKIYQYALHKFKDLKVSYNNFKSQEFNLKEYSQKSFGVYQNKLMNVELLFSKEKAEDVLNYNFHPTQKIKENEDGTITVKFKASGELEILWHIFKWGNSVKIVAPKELKKLYKEYLENVLINLK